MDISKWGCNGCGNLKGRYCTFFGQELEKDSYCPEYKYRFDIDSLKHKQLQIINHYGLDHQLDRLVEECSELIQAICKYKRLDILQSDILCTADIISEMADVLNLIEQIQLKDSFVKEGVNKVKEFKIDRELDRISKKI